MNDRKKAVHVGTVVLETVKKSAYEHFGKYLAEKFSPAAEGAADVSDAVAEIVNASRYVSQFGGGQGCVRDVVEQVMRARGDWYKEGDAPIRVASR